MNAVFKFFHDSFFGLGNLSIIVADAYNLGDTLFERLVKIFDNRGRKLDGALFLLAVRAY